MAVAVVVGGQTIVAMFAGEPLLGEQRGIPIAAAMPVVHHNRQALLNCDCMYSLREFMERRRVQSRVFTVTPLEIGRLVHEAGDVDVGRDRREARLEKGLLRGHRLCIVLSRGRSDILGSDGAALGCAGKELCTVVELALRLLSNLNVRKKGTPGFDIGDFTTPKWVKFPKDLHVASSAGP